MPFSSLQIKFATTDAAVVDAADTVGIEPANDVLFFIPVVEERSDHEVILIQLRKPHFKLLKFLEYHNFDVM